MNGFYIDETQPGLFYILFWNGIEYVNVKENWTCVRRESFEEAEAWCQANTLHDEEPRYEGQETDELLDLCYEAR